MSTKIAASLSPRRCQATTRRVKEGLEPLLVAVERVEVHARDERITHRVLLVQEPRGGARLRLIPRPPLVHIQGRLLLRVISIHDLDDVPELPVEELLFIGFLCYTTLVLRGLVGLAVGHVGTSPR